MTFSTWHLFGNPVKVKSIGNTEVFKKILNNLIKKNLIRKKQIWLVVNNITRLFNVYKTIRAIIEQINES